MRIGIDLNGVLTQERDDDRVVLMDELMLEYGYPPAQDITDLSRLYDRYYDKNREPYSVFMTKFITKFLRPITEKVAAYECDTDRFVLHENVKKYLDKWHQEGHKLFLISGAASKHYFKSKKMRDKNINVLMEWLLKEKLHFDGYVFSAYKKGLACQNLKIDLMIDNDKKNLFPLSGKVFQCVLFVGNGEDARKELMNASNFKELDDIVNSPIINYCSKLKRKESKKKGGKVKLKKIVAEHDPQQDYVEVDREKWLEKFSKKQVEKPVEESLYI